MSRQSSTTPPLPVQPKLAKRKRAAVTTIVLFRRKGSRFWQVRIRDGRTAKPVRRSTGTELQGAAEDFARLLQRHLDREARKPAASSQQPAASSQQPAASSQQPAASSQQPAASSQQPAASFD